MRNVILVFAALFITVTSYSDQCSYITERQADIAESFLNKAWENDQNVLLFCEPCGDKEPEVVRIKELRLKETTVSSVPVQLIAEVQNQEKGKADEVKTKGLDLAYVFVRLERRVYENLSKLADCNSRSVSHYVRVNEDGELIPSGVKE